MPTANEQQPAAAPDWVNKTPNDHEYSLSVMCYEESVTPCEDIELTRSEYIALKGRLAEMRGYATPEAPDAESAAKPNAEDPDTAAQLAELLKEAGELQFVGLSHLTAAAQALQQESPCYPVEEFVRNILEACDKGKLTPEVAQEKVDYFRQDFTEMREASQEFITKYGPDTQANPTDK